MRSEAEDEEERLVLVLVLVSFWWKQLPQPSSSLIHTFLYLFSRHSRHTHPVHCIRLTTATKYYIIIMIIFLEPCWMAFVFMDPTNSC